MDGLEAMGTTNIIVVGQCYIEHLLVVLDLSHNEVVIYTNTRRLELTWQGYYNEVMKLSLNATVLF